MLGEVNWLRLKQASPLLSTASRFPQALGQDPTDNILMPCLV